ncbi:hypothetical protein F6X40_09755 [Paraburkholderia sp. UCT31]|uniref:hypothetical protein n=1 Tax=Paraburkholderia sp. UCT31 TaxID=2615209 RepID=UPI0016559355|nr:hypothetical protein [Paraburkholderia sp. UCT31]MBC8737092.1 hypothetical protein [Paraburkholderia sp. UCT31]
MDTQARIKAAAQRMQVVVIRADKEALKVEIDARSLPGIEENQPIITLVGEAADNLFSEAEAYWEGDVTFAEVLAFLVEGYLEDFRVIPPKAVRERIDADFWCDLDATLASEEGNSCVGEAVVKLLNDVQAICTRIYAEDGGKVEPHYVEKLKAIALRQCLVWYGG